jgi:glycosyltransferase involved in cell wall biosynthesis
MATTTRFSTTLRDHARKTIEKLRYADIVIGIPSYYSGSSIVHVIQTIAAGLERHYPDAKAVILVADGGSTDDSREIANLVQIHSYNIEKIVTIYRGLPGKGSGLRAAFEVANFLRAKAVAVFDSDLVSIRPEWVKNVLDPVFNGYDFVAPYYRRYKLDGTITNTIAYNLTRALYGARVRQPIGGDFGISQRLAKHYFDQDVWETDVARFGIDIWMTTTAIVGGFKLCQARLGIKVHGEKDPGADLGPMFRQVVGTTFQLMETNAEYWQKVRKSRELPILGEELEQEPAPFEIDQDGLIDYFRMGWANFSGVWERIAEERDLEVIKGLASIARREDFHLPVETWVRIVYRYARYFHATSRQRFKILDTMVPLYNARVASIINEVRDRNPDEAERLFEAHALAFEKMKDYLVKIWDEEVHDG